MEITWIDDAVKASTSSHVAVIIVEKDALNVRWANTTLTTNGHMRTTSATVVALDQRADGISPSSVSGSVHSFEDLLTLVRAADEAAAGGQVSAEAMCFPEGKVGAGFDQAAATTDLARFQALADALGRAFVTAREQKHALYGFAEWIMTTTWLATSTGTRYRVVEPWGRFEFTAKEDDGKNSAWVGQFTKDFTDVDVDAHHRELQRRLGWGRRRIELPAGRYETILSPGAVVDYLLTATWDANEQDAIDGANAFAGAEPGKTLVGERLTSMPLSIRCDPQAPGLERAELAIVHSSQPGSTSICDNGAPVAGVEWFRDGVVNELTATRGYRAMRGGEGISFPTDNLIVTAQSDATLEDMIARTSRGLLINCLWYMRQVDGPTLTMTGLTRDGVYLIEDGEIVGAVNNFRYNESPLSLIRRCAEYSTSVPALCREWNDWFVYAQVPAMRIPDFEMSTVSTAH